MFVNRYHIWHCNTNCPICMAMELRSHLSPTSDVNGCFGPTGHKLWILAFFDVLLLNLEMTVTIVIPEEQLLTVLLIIIQATVVLVSVLSCHDQIICSLE